MVSEPGQPTVVVVTRQPALERSAGSRVALGEMLALPGVTGKD